jgi:hypothetical protein
MVVSNCFRREWEMFFKVEESIWENVVRDGRKYLVKYFGRSRNTINIVFLLRMGGGNTGLLGNCFSWNIWRYCKLTRHTVRKTEN